MTNDWDPEVIFAADQHECRIYGDDRCSEWAVVDEVDYAWAIQWCWTIVEPIPDGRRGRCRYFRRTARDQDGRCYTVYLHVAIQRRAVPVCPIVDGVVDHRDGDTFNCRRGNLVDATYAMNRRNARRYVYG
jgi:hypothetical protein